MCGDESVSWSIFAKFLPLIFETHFKKVKGMNRRLAPPAHSSAILSLGSWRRTNIDLSHALELTGLSRATDGRDKVYALLGLVDKGAGQSIVVDYTISPCKVFFVATQALIRDWIRYEDVMIEEMLQAILPKDNIESTSRRAIERRANFSGSPVRCDNIWLLYQYIYRLLEYSNSVPIQINATRGYVWKAVWDGETCGTWAAM